MSFFRDKMKNRFYRLPVINLITQMINESKSSIVSAALYKDGRRCHRVLMMSSGATEDVIPGDDLHPETIGSS